MGNLKEGKRAFTRQNEDKALIAVLQDDNSNSREREVAFNKLYSNNHRQLYFFLLKRTRSEEKAEDFKMVAFEKAHASIKKYDNKYAFSTWLHTIALNTLIDDSRKANFEVLSIDTLSARASENNDGMEFQVESDALNPEQTLNETEVIQAVRNAIDAIKDDFTRDIFELRYLKGLNFQEIADEMGVENNSTLRVTVNRGKEILRKALQNSECVNNL